MYLPYGKGIVPQQEAEYQKQLHEVSLSNYKQKIFYNTNVMNHDYYYDIYLEIFLKDLDGTGGLAVHLDICPPNKLSTIVRILPSISRTCARISLSTLSNRATPPLIPDVPMRPRLGFCSASAAYQMHIKNHIFI